MATDNPISSIEAQPLAAAAVLLNYLDFAGQRAALDRPEMTIVKTALLQASLGRGEPDVWSYYSRMSLT